MVQARRGLIVRALMEVAASPVPLAVCVTVTSRAWSLPQTLLTGSAGLGNPVAFSPDGHTLASGGGGDAIRLWDATNPAHPHPLGHALAGAAADVVSVAFSPDGRTLASGSLDGTTRLWNLDLEYAIQRICAAAGGLTPRQWHQYIPQLPYQPSCAR
jgi:WD40 repeat protein